jgi:hypothetical protein
MSMAQQKATDSNPYKRDVTFGPTYRYVHKECGRRVKKHDNGPGLTGSYYFCLHCDESYSMKGLAAYEIDEVRVDG